jgi:hypothetical protein
MDTWTCAPESVNSMVCPLSAPDLGDDCSGTAADLACAFEGEICACSPDGWVLLPATSLHGSQIGPLAKGGRESASR